MQSLKPLRALGKQSKLMEIGHARHHKFKMFLLGRSLKSNNEYFWVGNVADEGADAFYMQGEPFKILEAHELTNYKRYRDAFPRSGKLSINKVKAEKKAQSNPLFRNRVRITLNFPIDPCYLPRNVFEQISNSNVFRYINNLKRVEDHFGYPVKKYVVMSYPENLTDHARREYAKNGIMIKILGHRDREVP